MSCCHSCVAVRITPKDFCDSSIYVPKHLYHQFPQLSHTARHHLKQIYQTVKGLLVTARLLSTMWLPKATCPFKTFMDLTWLPAGNKFLKWSFHLMENNPLNEKSSHTKIMKLSLRHLNIITSKQSAEGWFFILPLSLSEFLFRLPGITGQHV